MSRDLLKKLPNDSNLTMLFGNSISFQNSSFISVNVWYFFRFSGKKAEARSVFRVDVYFRCSKCIRILLRLFFGLILPFCFFYV